MPQATDWLRWWKAPIWAAQLATGAKSFRDNPIIGSRRLNERGLHEFRVASAHNMAWRRRRKLAHLVSAEDREAFDRQGYVAHRDFLPAETFKALRDEVMAARLPAREMVQGDTITRRIALDSEALRQIPSMAAFLSHPVWSGLTRYVGAFDMEPLTYIQTILSKVIDAPPDPQTDLHADTFHPTVKAWFFLTDVGEDEGPFVYVPGSHRMTPERLAWEREQALGVADGGNRLAARGSFRLGPGDLERMKLAEPVAFAVPGNTLVVGDTCGFHARGPSLAPSTRVEIWGFGRRNPYLPFTGLDLLSTKGIAERRIGAMWAARDWLQRTKLGSQPWRDVGRLGPSDPPVRR